MQFEYEHYSIKRLRLKQKTVIFLDMFMFEIPHLDGGRELFTFASKSGMRRFVQYISFE
jgi:hypothetical protein